MLPTAAPTPRKDTDGTRTLRLSLCEQLTRRMLTIPEQLGLSGPRLLPTHTGRGEPGRPAERRLRVQRAVVDELDALDALRPSLDAREATDILWTLNHPTLWHRICSSAKGIGRPRVSWTSSPNRQLRGI
jgi:hypothetical protein